MEGRIVDRRPRPTFKESHAPPPWLRVVLYVVIPAAVLGYTAYQLDGAAGLGVGALIVAVILLCGALSLEISAPLYGNIKVSGGVLSVGRRAVPVSALDLSTLSVAETAEIYAVFGSGNLKSNPMWLRETVAVRGNHGGRPISVMVRTNRRDELVAALRATAVIAPHGHGLAQPHRIALEVA